MTHSLKIMIIKDIIESCLQKNSTMTKISRNLTEFILMKWMTLVHQQVFLQLIYKNFKKIVKSQLLIDIFDLTRKSRLKFVKSQWLVDNFDLTSFFAEMPPTFRIRFYIGEPNKVSFAALLWKERSMGERGPVLEPRFVA